MKLKDKFRIRKEMPLKKCRYCLSTENLTIDHKNPVSRGGTDDRKNLQCLCRRCNGFKSSISDGEIRALFRFVYQVNENRLALGKKEFEKERYEKRKAKS